jgi:peroxiredoxin
MVNLAYLVDDEKRQAMIGAGWDISPFQGNMNWTLPVPATFVIGRDGLVKARFIDPDYRKRMESSEILDVLRSLPN